jgi:hypothetical protein
MKERRLSPRSTINCKISVVLGLRILVFNADIENIGEGGIRAVLSEKLDIATSLEIDIFNKQVYLKLKGEVIWSNEKFVDQTACGFDTGIKFIDTTKDDKEKIRKLIEAFVAEQKA